MARDEGVVVQVGVGAIDAVYFGALGGAKRFVWVKAPDSFKQSLAAEDFVEAGDAAGEVVGGVEEGGVRVGDGDAFGEELGADRARLLAFGEELDGLSRPDGPVAEEAAGDAAFDPFAVHVEAKWSNEISDDVVIIAGVERDVVARRFGNGAHDIERLISVERGDLDGDDILDFAEFSPERV